MDTDVRCLGLVAGLALLASGPVFAGLDDYPFHIAVTTEDGVQRLVAHNDGDSPVSVRVTASGGHGSSHLPWPATLVVQPRARAALGGLGALGEGSSVHYTYYVGRFDAAAESHPCYRPPFADGEAFRVTQAFGGHFASHDNTQNRYAVDFAMPVGTPVTAARGGVVVDVTLRHVRHGLDPSFLRRANRILIVHDDGTVAEYAHLAPGPALVQRGARVAAGARIGYSGNTGYSTAPHLHFSVSKPALVAGKVKPVSIPFRFCGGAVGTAVAPLTGMLVRAAYPAAGLN